VLVEREFDQPVEGSPDDELLARHAAYPQDESHREFVETVDALIVEWVDDPRLELCISGESLRSAALGYERLLSSDSRFCLA
jgi:hypothetical protein